MLINGYNYIDSDPEVCFGQPRVAGSRIPIKILAHLIESGWSDEDIVSTYKKVNFKILNEIKNYISETGLKFYEQNSN